MQLSTLFQSVLFVIAQSFHWQNWPYVLFILHLKSLKMYNSVMKLEDTE